MVNVSKHKLPTTERQRLAKQFVHFMRGQFGDQQFTEFFTAAEQEVFIKRLAAVLLLDAGYTRYRVAATLHLSENTVKKYATLHKAGKFDHIIKRAKAK